jgi:hypothetical protein
MEQTRHALIVATARYSDAKLRQLRGPAADAEALAEVLRDPEKGNFQVEILADETQATLTRAIARFFRERRPQDLLLLHFSCHGVKDEDVSSSDPTVVVVVVVAARDALLRMTSDDSRRVSARAQAALEAAEDAERGAPRNVIPAGDLMRNSSFEQDLAGWDFFQAKLSRVRVPDAPDWRFAVRVAATKPGGT